MRAESPLACPFFAKSRNMMLDGFPTGVGMSPAIVAPMRIVVTLLPRETRSRRFSRLISVDKRIIVHF
jgi:hypothetical protein